MLLWCFTVRPTDSAMFNFFWVDVLLSPRRTCRRKWRQMCRKLQFSGIYFAPILRFVLLRLRVIEVK